MKLLHQNNPNIQFQNRHTLNFPLHIHNVLEVVFVRVGTATAVTGGQRYSLGPGDVFVSFPDQPHGYEDTRDIQCDVLIVPARPYLTPWRTMIAQKQPACPVLTAGSWEQTQIPQLLTMFRPECKTMPETVKQGLSLVILGKLLPLIRLTDRADSGSTVELLLHYISEHYREPLTRSDIARAVGYNESYVSHVFSQMLGTTLTDYITSLRLKDARALLTDTDMTVSQIALTLGFGSIRSFNRDFLKEFGRSPSRFRRSPGA